MTRTVASQPVQVVSVGGPDSDKLVDLTVRRIGASRVTTVFRHGDRDVIRAAERPFFVIGCQRQHDGDFLFWKVSWHDTLDRAHESLRNRRTSPTLSFAIVAGKVPA